MDSEDRSRADEPGQLLDRLFEVSWTIPPDALSPELRGLQGLLSLDGEVGNGGFMLLLDAGATDGARMLDDAIAGAELFEADGHLSVLRAFAEIGPASRTGAEWRRRAARGQEQPADLLSALEDLDERYYALPPISETVAGFVAAHPAAFAEFDLARPVPRRTREEQWLAACPELLADRSILEREIADLTEETLAAPLHRSRREGVHELVGAHLRTVLANAASADETVTLDQLRASWRTAAPTML